MWRIVTATVTIIIGSFTVHPLQLSLLLILFYCGLLNFSRFSHSHGDRHSLKFGLNHITFIIPVQNSSQST
jgi:hypothetical protein